MFGGLWLGLMWPILVAAPFGGWYCARHQLALAEGVAFAAALTVGLAPFTWFDWSVRHWLNADEIWFPLVLAFGLGIAVAPMIVAGRRIASRMAAKG